MPKRADGNASNPPVTGLQRNSRGNISLAASSRPSANARASANNSSSIRTPSQTQRMPSVNEIRQPTASRLEPDAGLRGFTQGISGLAITDPYPASYSRTIDPNDIVYSPRPQILAQENPNFATVDNFDPSPGNIAYLMDGPQVDQSEEADDDPQPAPLNRRQELARQEILEAINKPANQQLDHLWKALRHLTKYEISEVPLSGFSAGSYKCAREGFKCPEESVVRFTINGIASKYHANYIQLNSMPEAKLIATQHPPTSAIGQNNFIKMLYCVADVVFDIRSAIDMTKPDAVAYLPGTTHNRITGDIEVLKENYRNYSNIVKEKNVTLIIERAQKALKVFQYRRWPDASITSKAGLRHLADILDAQLLPGKRVAIHCRMGVGRTGTMITYYDARKQLLAANKPVTVEDIHSLVFKDLLNYRMQRGEIFIQKQSQLNLVIETLKEDMQDAGLLRSEIHDSIGIMDLVSISG